MLWSLFGFVMGMIVACFQGWGIVLMLRAMLYMFVRYLMASDPRCLRYPRFMLLGPGELLFVLFEISNCTFVMVNYISLVGRVLIVWSIYLLILLVLYGVTLVNCLLKAFALSMSMMAVSVPKQMLQCCCVCGFLLCELCL